MAFHPNGNDPLPIDDVPYRIAEHPAARGIPYGQEGRAATVYALYTETERRALKVFKSRFRVPSLVGLARRLDQYATLPGLQVCHRTVLVPQYHASLLRQHPDLLYAVLMPWVNGPTWMEVLLDLREITPEQSLQLALGLADVLGRMEQMGLAHCDLSASNLIISALANPPVSAPTPLSLVDVEQLYGPGLERPEAVPGGSPGYAHNMAPKGLWDSTADRFAGAVLLAEMLGWCDTRVRASAWGESYFAPEEMQRTSPRYTLLHNVLAERWGYGASSLFERAWRSASLDECPTFDEWLIGLPDTVPTVSTPASSQDAQQAAPAMSTEADHAVRTLMEDARKLSAQGKRVESLAAYREALSLAPPGSELAEELSFIIDGLTHQPIPSPLPAPAPYQPPSQAQPEQESEQQRSVKPEPSEPAPLPSYKPPTSAELDQQTFSQPPPIEPQPTSPQPAPPVQPVQAQAEQFQMQPAMAQQAGPSGPPPQVQQPAVPFQQPPPPPRQQAIPASGEQPRRFNIVWLLAGLLVLLIAAGVTGFILLGRQDTPIIAAGEPTATSTVEARVPTATSAVAQVDPTEVPQPTATNPVVAQASTDTPQPPPPTDTAVPAPPTEEPQPTPTVPTLCFNGGSPCVAGRFLDMWKTLGGKDEGSPGDAGVPLANAETVNGVLTQRFERYTMEYRPEKAPFDVQFANLGLERYKQVFGHDPAPVQPIPGCRFFEQTGHNMCEAFLPFWQNHGPSLGISGDKEAISLLLYGNPISDAADESINGKTMTVQWFEKARFEFRPDDPQNPVQLGLLGSELSK